MPNRGVSVPYRFGPTAKSRLNETLSYMAYSFTTVDGSDVYKTGKKTEISGSIDYNPLDYSGAIGRNFRINLRHQFSATRVGSRWCRRIDHYRVVRSAVLCALHQQSQQHCSRPGAR